MSKRKTAVGTIAGSAFAGFLATAPMYLFTVPNHPRVVFWLMVGSASVCVVFVFLWFFVPDSDKNVKAAPSAASTIGGDNSGAQMTAGRDIYIYPNTTPTPPPAAAQVSAADNTPHLRARTRTAALPTLRFTRRTEQVAFDSMRSSWRLGYQGEEHTTTVLVLWIENMFPTQGTGRNLSNLIASVRAEQLDSITIARGYWIGQRDNEITLASGAELGIVVGHFDGRERFICYDNPHAPPSSYQIMDDGFRALGHRANLELVVRDEGTTPLTITVTIAQRPEQTVLACKQIIITLPQRIMDMRDCGREPGRRED